MSEELVLDMNVHADNAFLDVWDEKKEKYKEQKATYEMMHGYGEKKNALPS